MRSIEELGIARPSGKGRFLVGDSESKGLLTMLVGRPDEQHIIVLRDVMTKEVFIFFDPYEDRNPRQHLEMDGDQDGYLIDAIHMMQECEGYAFHNLMGYDYPAFVKCFGDVAKMDRLKERSPSDKLYHIFPFKCMDTYVVSTLLNPDRRPPPQAYALGMGNVGPHSIAAHGIRIGRFKPDHEDWSILSDDMIHRCVEDTEIGADLLLHLMQGEWAETKARKHKGTGLDICSAYKMELEMGYQMVMQADRGVRLDMKWCMDTWNELNEKINATEAAFREHMPQRICKKKKDTQFWVKTVQNMRVWLSMNHEGCPKIQRWLQSDDSRHIARYQLADRGSDLTTQWELTTKKGDYTAALRKVFPEMSGNKHDKKDPLVVGPFTPVRFEDIPLGNRDSVKQVLFAQGWLGVNYNDTEQEHIDEHGELPCEHAGKIDEDSIKAWQERFAADGRTIPAWCVGIAEWYILCSRRNQILNPKDVAHFDESRSWPSKGCRGLIGQARCRSLGIMATEFYETYGKWPVDEDEEWVVPAVCIPIATNTFRARHKVVVNIPARGLYPLRRAFIARKGYKIVGIDGAGLELRMLSHFMNDPEYEQVILSGDIHTHNQELAGLRTRDMAKTWIYALLYGSGDANLARTLGMTLSEVKAARARFMVGLPALDSLLKRLEAQASANGYCMAFDGRRGYIRRRDGQLATHTALNVLLQMTGSLCMKWGMYYSIKQLEEWYGEVPCLIFYHDEYQMEVPEDEVIEKTFTIQGESKKATWKIVEKQEYHDELGQWSAPVSVHWDEETNTHTYSRQFHRVGSYMADMFTLSGKEMGIRTPLAGEYKVGAGWHETH